ncbi:alpha/beta fold hydrolase [Paenibacillus sp. UNC499MF]|uniref:alpha/beta fold hydrolase n=1 Tax=Paenibacillus sp. UNC499MF TaxID=1502751 RepID=UPI0008A05FB2|nr:alpha/beta hydrolase [Paenibacillus sp. UNC499MF]SEG71665.1 Pimeloyl-ACP methyl ester carboxylesterase [Paenibacillus sp. UNC499MF]
MKVTQQEDKKTRSGTRTSKVLKILLKIIGAILAAIVLFLAIVYSTDKISSHSEQKRLEPYGQTVAVDGKSMNVFIQGKGEETVVLLPGFGTAAPALDFKPLIEELSPFYKVVAVEPFGYGLSDGTGKERTTENIVSEIHEALQSLQIDKYILMAHSISGIYGLHYVNKYPNEVSAFVGLDSSVPALSEKRFSSSEIETVKLLKKSGFTRLLTKPDMGVYVDLPYDNQTIEQIKILMYKNMYNPNQLNEIENMHANFTRAENSTFPTNLPVIFFIQANHPAADRWIPEHEKQIKDSVHGKVVLLEAEHYLYRSHSKEITENFRKFMKEIKEVKLP